MSDSLYHISFPRPLLSSDSDEIVFFHGLTGYVDAGNAIYLTTEHLLSSLESELVATFDIDKLVGYPARRPTLALRDGHLGDLQTLHLKLWMVHDNKGTPFLLLEGHEPDLRWEGLIEDLLHLTQLYNVKKVVGFASVGMPVPHSRPVPVLYYGEDPAPEEPLTRWEGKIRFPSTFDTFIDYHLGLKNRQTEGLTGQVPNYLAQSHYAPTAARLIESMCSRYDLDIPQEALKKDAHKINAEIEEQLQDNPELLTAIEAMEANYDSFKEEYDRRKSEERQLQAIADDLLAPSEIGEELEKLLSQVDSTKKPPRDESQ